MTNEQEASGQLLQLREDQQLLVASRHHLRERVGGQRGRSLRVGLGANALPTLSSKLPQLAGAFRLLDQRDRSLPLARGRRLRLRRARRVAQRSRETQLARPLASSASPLASPASPLAFPGGVRREEGGRREEFA